MCDDQPEAGYYQKGRYMEPPQPQATVSDNPEVGRLLGPDGKLAKIVRAKPERTIGYKPTREAAE
jgi:hypothetical protein